MFFYYTSWFVDLNQNLCDFDSNQFGTPDFDLIYEIILWWEICDFDLNQKN